MEPIGLTAGLLNLAGLFNNAIDWFDYIQLAQNFGTDFQSSLLKLDVERLRLSRWGKAMGINGSVDHTQSLEGTSISEQEMKRAEQLLGMVIKLLDDAKKVSEKFVRDLRPSEEALRVGNPQAELEPVALSLHHKMRSLCLSRQNRTGLQRKIKWALYEERHFRKLIGDIGDLINDLVTLFPSFRPVQQQLCEAEVTELGSDERALAILRDAVVDHDADLEAAIERDVQNRAKNAMSNTFINHGKVGQQVVQQWVTGGLHFN